MSIFVLYFALNFYTVLKIYCKKKKILWVPELCNGEYSFSQGFKDYGLYYIIENKFLVNYYCRTVFIIITIKESRINAGKRH